MESEPTSATPQTTPWLNAFNSLRAEHESDWLNKVFIKPESFSSMVGMQSFVVFGEEGSGKTALHLALINHASNHTDAVPLFVQWHPMIIEEEPRQIVRVFIGQILDACARELLRYIYQNPSMFKNAQPWVQEATSWFIQTKIAGDWEFELTRLDAEHSAENIEGLRKLLSEYPRMILPADAPLSRIIAQIASIVVSLGAQGVWVLVDGMESLVEQDKDLLANTLRAILSTLAFFEEPNFAIKMMAPRELETDLLSVSSTIRRRWDPFYLDWSTEQLINIIETRAAIMLGKVAFNIKDLYASQDILTWLEKYGDLSPRGWLETARPFVQFQQAKKDAMSLTSDEFKELCNTNLPRLRIDLRTDEVFVGYGRITSLQPSAYKLLRYLYVQKNRTSSREELYFCAYKGLDEVPDALKDDAWVAREQWEGAIDSAIYRIRQAIEPNPSEPVYLISDAGKSIVHLKQVW